MVDFTYRRKIFNIREMAFATLKDGEGKKCDVVYLHSSDFQIPFESKKVYAQKQYTLINNLEQDEDQLLLKVKKNCRYEIRRAEKEGAVVKIYTSFEEMIAEDILEKFEKTYNHMFKSKNMSNCFNKELASAAVKSNQLVITTCALESDSDCKVYHAYLADKNSTVLMYSASPLWNDDDKEKANCIGRLNKHLHWQDIQWFKNNGYKRYEWGGISDPETPNGIDRFKSEFGGDTVCLYNYLVSNSLLGQLYLYLVKRRNSK